MTEMNTAALPENIEDQIRDKADEVSRIVEAFLPEITGFPKTVCGAMAYSVEAGGKRLRPILMQ